MTLRDIIKTGRIVKILRKVPYKNEGEDPLSQEDIQKLGLYDWGEPEDVTDESILNLSVQYEESLSAHPNRYTVSPFPWGDNEVVLERKRWNDNECAYIVTIATPIEVLINEKIEEIKKEFNSIEKGWGLVRGSGQDGKTISKRTETAINRYTELKGLGEVCTYYKYDQKRLNIRPDGLGSRSFLCQIDIHVKNNPEEEWEQVHNWFKRELRWRENLIANLKKELTELSLYQSLSDEMKNLRKRIEPVTENASSIIKNRFPLLFGFSSHLSADYRGKIMSLEHAIKRATANEWQEEKISENEVFSFRGEIVIQLDITVKRPADIKVVAKVELSAIAIDMLAVIANRAGVEPHEVESFLLTVLKESTTSKKELVRYADAVEDTLDSIKEDYQEKLPKTNKAGNTQIKGVIRMGKITPKNEN